VNIQVVVGQETAGAFFHAMNDVISPMAVLFGNETESLKMKNESLESGAWRKVENYSRSDSTRWPIMIAGRVVEVSPN
jgi:hypothetical protein